MLPVGLMRTNGEAGDEELFENWRLPMRSLVAPPAPKTGRRPFYPPQVFVVKKRSFEQQLWGFVNGSFATVFNEVGFGEH